MDLIILLFRYLATKHALIQLYYIDCSGKASIEDSVDRRDSSGLVLLLEFKPGVSSF